MRRPIMDFDVENALEPILDEKIGNRFCGVGRNEAELILRRLCPDIDSSLVTILLKFLCQCALLKVRPYGIGYYN